MNIKYEYYISVFFFLLFAAHVEYHDTKFSFFPQKCSGHFLPIYRQQSGNKMMFPLITVPVMQA